MLGPELIVGRVLKLRVTFVCLLAFLLAAVLAHSAFHGFANSGDEYSYLFQAQLFASGRLSSPSPPAELWSSLQLDHVISDGMMRSKYFPGWPALLPDGSLGRHADRADVVTCSDSGRWGSS